MMSRSRIGKLVRHAGYDHDTPLAAGVSGRSREPLLFAQGADGAGAPFGPYSVVYEASVSKQITGACAALLEQAGALDPEKQIVEWLPELPPWSERIRLRHLIHQTAGLPKVWRATCRGSRG